MTSYNQRLEPIVSDPDDVESPDGQSAICTIAPCPATQPQAIALCQH